MLVENARRRDREEEEREAEENGAREERRQQRENEMNEISEKIDGLHLKFIMEKFTVVDIPLSLNEDSLSLHTAKPNIRVITNNVQRDDVAIFFALHKRELWDHVAEKTNIELNRKVTQKEIKETYYKQYLRKPVSGSEIIHILALRQFFRTRYGNRSLEKQFNDCPPPPLTKWMINHKRYSSVISALTCDWKIFCDILRKGWRDAVDPGDKMTVDETMFAYYSQNDKTSPQVNIPRKPHPNGLLSNSSSFELESKVPYIFDIEPEVKRGDKCNPRDALNAMLHRRPWNYVTPKITIDAGFSGEDEIMVMKNLGFKFVAAVNSHHKKWLVELLEYHCPLNATIAVKDPNGFVWSFKKTQNKNLIVVTNMFGGSVVTQSGAKLIDKSNESILGKLSKPILSAILTEMRLTYSDPSVPIETVIANHLNSKYSNHRDEQITPTATAQSRSDAQTQENAPVENSEEPFTEANLQSKNMKSLKEITKKMNLRSSNKKKSEVIEMILQAQQVPEGEVERLKYKLSRNHLNSTDIVHKYYASNFNLIDVIDRYWYDINSHHKIDSWESKFIISLLEMGFVNSYAISKTYRTYENFSTYVDDLVLKLLSRPIE